MTTEHRSNSSLVLAVAVAVALAPVVAALTPVSAAVAAAEEASPPTCEVEIRADYVGADDYGDGRKLQFEVEIESPADCARVEYDLVIEERQPNNQVHRVRKTQITRVRDATLTQLVDHVERPGYEMLDYEVREVSCTPCGTEAPDDVR